MGEHYSTSEVRSSRTKSVIEIVNLVGSVASITGITLLWLKDTLPISPLDVPWAAGIVSVFIGIMAVCVIIFRSIYVRWFRNKDIVVKVAFFTLAAPVAALL